MVPLRKFRIKASAIALSLIIGGLLALFFSGCTQKSELLLAQYEERDVVKDDEGNQYKVVYKNKFPQGYGCDIFIYKSTDGQSWHKIGAIPSSGYQAYKVWGYSLAWGDGVLYFVCVGTGKGKKAVYFSKSLDNGSTWTDPKAINDDIWAQRSSPKISIKGKNIFVAWLEKSERGPSGKGRPSGLYFCSSSDGGENWHKNIWIRQSEDFWITPGEDETVYLAYVGGKRQNIIYLSYSEDGEREWHTETPGELPLLVKGPYIAFRDGRIYLIFQGARPSIADIIPGSGLNYQVYCIESRDRGKN